MEVPSYKGEALHNASCTLQQAFIPKSKLGRVESERKGQERKGFTWKGKSKRKGACKDLFPLQPREMQLSEVQVQPCLQSLFQEGPQWFELQGREAPARYHGDTLTRVLQTHRCKGAASTFKEVVTGAVRFFWET